LKKLPLAVLLIVFAIVPVASGEELPEESLACGDEVARADGVGGGDGPACSDCFDSVLLAPSAQSYQDVWFNADYLLWRTNGSWLPPLVTTSPAGTPINQAGQLDEPSTTVLAGNQSVSGDWRYGFRLDGGFRLLPSLAIVLDYFNAGRDAYGFSANSNTSPILARPFLDAQTGDQNSELIGFPNEYAGRINLSSFAHFQGAGGGLQKCLWDASYGGNHCDSETLNLIAGYRYYQHDSLLEINHDATVLQVNPPGNRVIVQDRFVALNEFNGGELGVQGRLQRSRWWFYGLAKFAIGANRRTIYISGSRAILNAAGTSGTISRGGLLTSDLTNIGTYINTRGAFIPQFRIGAGYQLTHALSIKAGYNLIIWNNVVQAASELPPGLAVDPRNIPNIQAGGGRDPAFPGFRGTNLVAHGFDFGLTLAY
jgi:hypothetical protein